MDGLPIHKSSRYEFWPILATIHEIAISPLIVAIFYGQSKPPVNDFLNDFVNEMKHLIENGIDLNGKHFAIGIGNFVCDSPARAFIKGTVK